MLVSKFLNLARQCAGFSIDPLSHMSDGYQLYDSPVYKLKHYSCINRRQLLILDYLTSGNVRDAPQFMVITRYPSRSSLRDHFTRVFDCSPATSCVRGIRMKRSDVPKSTNHDQSSLVCRPFSYSKCLGIR